MSRHTPNRRTATALSVGVCPTCGKRRYPSRRDARKAARLAHPGDHLRAYLCGAFWHLGHPRHSGMRGAPHGLR